MVLSRQSGDRPLDQGADRKSAERSLRSGRIPMPTLLAVVFGGASLVSSELFSHFSEGGAPFLMALVALLPLQAVALIWIWSQRRVHRSNNPGSEER